MKILTIILIPLLIIGILIIGVLGYFGFIPGVSALMGTDKPRDLGMAYSAKDFDSGLQKSKVEMKTLNESSPVTIMYEGSHEVKGNFTDEELTSHAHSRDWVDYPISDVQVRINEDDTCEVSGMIDLTKVDNLLSALNISQAEYKDALAEANIPLKKLPFYAKGFGTASDNSLDASISRFEVGRFPVPQGIVDKYNPALMSFGETIMKTIPGFSVNEARFEDGSIYFDGTLPDVEYTKRR